MKQQQPHYSVVQMAKWLELSRSGFYGWLKTKQAPARLHRQLLEVKIRAAHAHGRKTYLISNLPQRFVTDQPY